MSDVKAKMQLREWLFDNGYIAYPHEMLVGYFCDVIGYRKGEFYAFEIKQKGDRVGRALKQLEVYRRHVHYCIVVADKIGKRLTQKFMDKGFGVWLRKGNNYEELVKPQVTDFLDSCVEHTRDKFQRYYKSLIIDREQMMIEGFHVKPTIQKTLEG